MKTNTTASLPGKSWQSAIALFVLVAGLVFGLVSGRAHAAPLAGTVIGNTATATYTDATSTPRTATSNPVNTTVTQVKSFTLTADGARTASAGQTVYFPHTLTNTGNGPDTYTLNAITLGGAFNHTTPAYYADADGNGVPDSLTPITGPIALPPAPGTNTFRFVVGGTVPGTATNGQTGTMTPSVTDTNTPTPTTTPNTDTTTVANSAITMTKALSLTSGGSPAGPITVTLSYTNTGSAAALGLAITDVLDSRFTYVPSSGRWSVSGVTALDDGAGGDPAGINYGFAAGTVTATIASVPATSSGTLTFQVNVNSGVAPGNIPNTASYLTTTQTTANTNTATYQVLQVAGVVANGSATDSEAVSNVNHPAIAYGSTAVFTNYIWNRGNAADTFVITLEDTATYPPGTAFNLMQADGVTPLVANTTPSIPVYTGGPCPAPFVTDSTGPVTACGYPVVLRVTLPVSGAGTTLAVIKRATSSFNGAVNDPVTDTLAGISANVVDLTNGTARQDSAPAGTANAGNAATTGFGVTGTTVITTNNVTPLTTGTTTTRFTLFVNNVGGINDTFTLGATGLPAGWTLTFRADGGGGACATVGASLGTAVLVNAGANRLVCAELVIPATTSGQAAAGNHDIDFTATSQTNGAVNDTKRDRVILAEVRSVTVVPPQTQQTYPGGSVTYQHTITNLGNVTETISFNASLLTNSQGGWTAQVYLDAGTAGVFDPGVDDVPGNLIGTGTSFPLATNGAQIVWVRVFAPGAVTPANVTTFTARYGLAGALSASVADTTTITEGLLLSKEQSLMTGGCGMPVVGYGTGALSAAPGTCIAYRITGTNVTAANITSVVINDNIPANTRQWNACFVPATTIGTISSPGDNLPGTVSATVGTLTPAQVVSVTFCVRIDP